MPYYRKNGSTETALKWLMGEEGEGDTIKKTLGSYNEVIDFAKDPLMHMFYAHIRSGLKAFSQEGQDSEQALLKYKYMLRLAEAFLGEKYGEDFVEIRKNIAQEVEDDAERLLREVQKVAELLEKGTRRVEVVLYLAKKDILDFHREQQKEFGDGGDEGGEAESPSPT